MALFDPDYRFVRVNRALAQMLDTTEEALVGASCDSVIQPDEAAGQRLQPREPEVAVAPALRRAPDLAPELARALVAAQRRRRPIFAPEDLSRRRAAPRALDRAAGAVPPHPPPRQIFSALSLCRYDVLATL